MSETILTCCVVFNQNILHTNTYNTLLKNLKDVIIYDNSQSSLIDKSFLPSEWVYIHDSSNPGLSYAYNYCAKYAISKGYNWLLIADQDTIFPEDAFFKYEKAVHQYFSDILFCPIVTIGQNRLMSPINCKHYIPHFISFPIGCKHIKLCEFSIINSGLLININAFFSVGGYNTDVFLDFSDFQFIERLSLHYKYARVLNIKCIQSFSNDDQNEKQKIHRYNLFCKSLKKYKCNRRINKIYIYLVMIRRCISLIKTTKNFSPITILLRSFVQ